ncbi:MAG: hypothetical protein GX125_06135 [Bacteroidales bacterium]|jgi:hypothetical protein|nr:glycosyl hydrolase family 28 protein [Bacteroidota bacterium]NLN99822.1 hypothetical protein [Bacteroidales bacterium]
MKTIIRSIPAFIILTFCPMLSAQEGGKDMPVQKTVAYTPVSGMNTSEDFTVSSNGHDIWVESIGPGGMENLNAAVFSCEGRQRIIINAGEPIESYSIQPKSTGIRGAAKGERLEFEIPGPCKLYIKVNSKPYLALFANPLETDAPKEGAKGVDYYGPGNHDVGQIEIHDNQTIYISGGAHVSARVTGSAKNVRIFGRGSLTGNIRVSGCENFSVEGIFMRNTSGWANTVTNSTATVYDNVKVFSHTGTWGLDGINPVSCKGFLINDCFLRTRDDCVAVKSNGNPEDYDLSSRDITVENSIMVGWDHADGVTLGFELNGGAVENVLVRNCDILRARGSGRTGGHSAFSIVCDGASQVRNIYFEDIRVEADIEYKNLEIILTEAERYGNGVMGSLEGVHLKNVSWENAMKPFTIVGHPTRFVKNVTFTNCYVGGKLLTGLEDADFQIEFAEGIEFVPGGAVTVDRYPNQEVRGRVAGQRRPTGTAQNR